MKVTQILGVSCLALALSFGLQCDSGGDDMFWMLGLAGGMTDNTSATGAGGPDSSPSTDATTDSTDTDSSSSTAGTGDSVEVEVVDDSSSDSSSSDSSDSSSSDSSSSDSSDSSSSDSSSSDSSDSSSSDSSSSDSSDSSSSDSSSSDSSDSSSSDSSSSDSSSSSSSDSSSSDSSDSSSSDSSGTKANENSSSSNDGSSSSSTGTENSGGKSNSGGSDNSGTSSSDSSGSDKKDSTDTKDSSDKSDTEDTDDGTDVGKEVTQPAEKSCGLRTITLDTTQGKWLAISAVKNDDDDGKDKGKGKGKAKGDDKADGKSKGDDKKSDSKADGKGKSKGDDDYGKGKGKGKGHDGDGHKNNVDGIYTETANQHLIIKVRNNCQAGFYHFDVTAKNHNGKVPKFFKDFNIKVIDAESQKGVGALQIKASDSAFHKGQFGIQLGEGDTDIVLNWTNDAFKKDAYDTNLHVKTVAMTYPKKYHKKKRFVRMGAHYCDTNGRWFFEKKGLFTFWADQKVSYCFDVAPGKYEVEVKGVNHSELGLPGDYTHFNVGAAGDGVEGSLKVEARDNGHRSGKTVLDFTGGFTKITFNWSNDSQKDGEYDTNFLIHQVKLKRIGDSERSAVAAYIMNASQSNKIIFLVIFMAAMMGLGVILIRQKLSANAG